LRRWHDRRLTSHEEFRRISPAGVRRCAGSTAQVEDYYDSIDLEHLRHTNRRLADGCCFGNLMKLDDGDIRPDDDKVMVYCYHYEALKMMAIARYEEGKCSRMRLAQLLTCSLFHLDEAIDQHKKRYPEVQMGEVIAAKERAEAAKRKQ